MTNDKGVYNRSWFGAVIHTKLPKGKMIVGDAGYQLFTHLMAPYDISPDMPRDERNYNYLHSNTRIIVEQAFGLLKGRFRIFKTALNMKGNMPPASTNGLERDHTATEKMTRLIRSCFVLHNILIDLKDQTTIDIDFGPQGTDPYCPDTDNIPAGSVGGSAAKSVGDAVKSYLKNIKNRRSVYWKSV